MGWVRLVAGLAAALLVLAALGYWAWAPIREFSTTAVERGGLPGLYLAVAIMECVPGGGFQIPLAIGWAGGAPLVPMIAVATCGSFTATLAMWGLGRALRSRPRVLARIEASRAGQLLHARGRRAVAVAAIAPVPFALVVLLAGAGGVPLSFTLLGACARPLKMIATIALLAVGWGGR